MPKLYVFAIGGTGSRVLRSLTMLAAAGVDIQANEIVPVIIDPDASNADLTRAVTLMNSYSSIREGIDYTNKNETSFFKCEISQIVQNYSLHIKDTNNRRFDQFIEYSALSTENKAMMSMLFSEKNLDAQMQVGFKGNPNIGSVVLNQIVSSPQFTQFANSFAGGDKIFIISSIFGGTGASGFPLLLKTLRDPRATFPNRGLINGAQIGAVTILPYFKLQPSTTSEIDSSTFISKARAALAYYETNVVGNDSINALYYLADDGDIYDNNDGGCLQQNPAHIIELIAATAAINFINANYSGKHVNLEFGINDVNDNDGVTFGDFYPETQTLLMKPMTQLAMMANFLTKGSKQMSMLMGDDLAANNKICAKEKFYSSSYFKELVLFMEKYKEWLRELSNNKRSLNLFNLNCGDKPFELVTDRKPNQTSIFGLGKKDYESFYGALNKASGAVRGGKASSLFMEMFSRATKKLAEDKLKM
jgi:hypothetical protein